MPDAPQDEPDGQAGPDGPADPPDRPGRRRGLRRPVAATALTAVLLATAGLGCAYRENFAALGAYRFAAPPTFRSLPAHQDGTLTVKATTVVVTRSLGPLGAYHTGVSRGLGPIEARYGDGLTDRVSAYGRHQHFFDPAASLHEHLDRLRRSGVPVDGLRTVDPGPRGGAMACGMLPAQHGSIGECIWADGSMLVTYDETTPGSTLGPAELASHARDFRTLAEVPD
ncbi:hypothetical protein [Kitasatospora arboriphila]|uniref:Uncharacterized protein n=1 Tax=Kitasatospora arboriphila TaxID=258052 RepID=A0ABP4E4B2_9ACTN